MNVTIKYIRHDRTNKDAKREDTNEHESFSHIGIMTPCYPLIKGKSFLLGVIVESVPNPTLSHQALGRS